MATRCRLSSTEGVVSAQDRFAIFLLAVFDLRVLSALHITWSLEGFQFCHRVMAWIVAGFGGQSERESYVFDPNLSSLHRSLFPTGPEQPDICKTFQCFSHSIKHKVLDKIRPFESAIKISRFSFSLASPWNRMILL